MGGLAPSPALAGTPLFLQMEWLLIFQLTLGGILIMFMDEVVSKWGLGSGISLFIAAGVAQEIFIRAFNFLPSPTIPVILVAAFIANIQLFARLLEKWGHPLFGTFSGNSPISGLVYWINAPDLVQNIIRGSFTLSQLGQAGCYILSIVKGQIYLSKIFSKTLSSLL